jgi:hypothetical protein
VRGGGGAISTSSNTGGKAAGVERAYARWVQKQGVALADVEGFPGSAADLLRDELSVTTAEEFVDLSQRMGPALQALLEMDDAGFARLRGLAEAAATATEAPAQPGEFRTGMDPPPEGRDTYSG